MKLRVCYHTTSYYWTVRPSRKKETSKNYGLNWETDIVFNKSYTKSLIYIETQPSTPVKRKKKELKRERRLNDSAEKMSQRTTPSKAKNKKEKQSQANGNMENDNKERGGVTSECSVSTDQ
jgi:hypothetical protein